MPDIFSRPKVSKVPPPEPPAGLPETGAGDVTKQRKLMQGVKTNLTGQLTPSNIRKRRLLGLT